MVYADGTAEKPTFEFLVILENTDAECTGVCKDGWQALIDIDIEYDSAYAADAPSGTENSGSVAPWGASWHLQDATSVWD